MRRVWILVLLLVGMIGCGGASGEHGGGGGGSLIGKDAPRLFFWAVDLSGFHGDGEAVWVDEVGHVFVQKATRGSGGTINAIHRYTLDAGQLGELRSFVATFRPSSLEVIARTGVPDEVRAHFGFRDPSGHLQKRAIWSTDWPKQATDVRRFREHVAAVRQHANADNRVSSEEVKDGELTLKRPEGLLPGESVP